MLHEKALLVTLSFGLPPMAKTDRRITADIRQQHGTDKLRASKTLLPDTAIEPIRTVHREAYEWHRKHTVAWGDNADRLLASAHYLDYANTLRGFRQRADQLADDFTANYPSYVEEAQRQLNGAFNSADYPSQASIRGKFKFQLDFAPVPDGGDFRISIQRDEMDALRSGIEDRIAQAERTAKADVARRIAEPLAAMVRRLSEPDAVFRDTLVTNLREICDLLPALNITGDDALEGVRQNILAGLYHADPDLLRENPTVRASTARKAQNILDTMATYFGPIDEAA